MQKLHSFGLKGLKTFEVLRNRNLQKRILIAKNLKTHKQIRTSQ